MQTQNSFNISLGKTFGCTRITMHFSNQKWMICRVFFPQEISLPPIGMGHWNQGLINAVVLPEGKAWTSFSINAFIRQSFIENLSHVRHRLRYSGDYLKYPMIQYRWYPFQEVFLALFFHPPTPTKKTGSGDFLCVPKLPQTLLNKDLAVLNQNYTTLCLLICKFWFCVQIIKSMRAGTMCVTLTTIFLVPNWLLTRCSTNSCRLNRWTLSSLNVETMSNILKIPSAYQSAWKW